MTIETLKNNTEGNNGNNDVVTRGPVRQKLRPVHIWLLGVLLFLPSIFTWAISLGVEIYRGEFNVPFDRIGILFVYLPLLAAVVGFVTPILCLRLLRDVSWKVTNWLFSTYLVVMLVWGVIDIRNYHFQMGYHGTLGGIFDGGRRGYVHVYFTWYFLPDRLIETWNRPHN